MNTKYVSRYCTPQLSIFIACLVFRRTPTRGQIFSFSYKTAVRKTKFVQKKIVITDLTDQLCNPFLNDLFDLDVDYLVVTAELLCNSGFANSWRSYKADSNRLQTQMEKRIRAAFIWYQNSFLHLKYPIKVFVLLWMALLIFWIQTYYSIHCHIFNTLTLQSSSRSFLVCQWLPWSFVYIYSIFVAMGVKNNHSFRLSLEHFWLEHLQVAA